MITDILCIVPFVLGNKGNGDVDSGVSRKCSTLDGMKIDSRRWGSVVASNS